MSSIGLTPARWAQLCGVKPLSRHVFNLTVQIHVVMDHQLSVRSFLTAIRVLCSLELNFPSRNHTFLITCPRYAVQRHAGIFL